MDRARMPLGRLPPSRLSLDLSLASFQESVNPFAVITGEREQLAVAQAHSVVAIEQWLQFLDGVEVHDGRAADTQETVGGQVGFQSRQSLPEQVVLATDVELHVVTLGLEPVDVWSSASRVPNPQRS
jgi:hypothetical protein